MLLQFMCVRVISCSALFDVSIKAVCLGSIKRDSGVSSGCLALKLKGFYFFIFYFFMVKVALLLCCQRVAFILKEGDVPVVSGIRSYIEVGNVLPHT